MRLTSSKLKRGIPQLLTILLYLLLVAAVAGLMNYVQNLLNSDVEINLTEVAIQNRDVVQSKLNLEMTKLDSIASSLVSRLDEQSDPSAEPLLERFLSYSDEVADERLFLARNDGTAIWADGSTLDISGRKYFNLSVEGIQNISDCVVSRKDGEDIFVISVPVSYHNEILGTLQRIYTQKEMYELCAISSFSSQGYMNIINHEGYVLISSRQSERPQQSNNYFRSIYALGNKEQSEQLKQNIEAGKSGFIETNENGEKIFSAYTQLEGIHDWCLISSVPTSAVSPNGNIVIQMFYVILIIVTLIFAGSLLGFFAYKKKQQDHLEELAFVDTVTTGKSYTKFIVDLKRTLHDYPNETFYLLKFDIDNFKYFNNFYGFDFGDKILYTINHSIAQKLYPLEMIARIYSDHFIVLLKDTSEEHVSSLLQSIQNEENIVIYYSAGIYKITDPSETINLMVDKASTAALNTKGTLNALQYYTEEFDQLMIYNEQLKRSVSDALNNNEIIPFYQPKVDVNTGQMVGAEALARWQKQDGTLVPPGAFVPMCEKTGLIVDLDMAILEKVLQFIKRNLDSGISCVPISVNFSRLHLLNDTFFDRVYDKVRAYGVPPELLELELTESAIFENYESILKLIVRLHEAGFSISMDDFGSGYSSLNMLKDIPIDVLKIDREFLTKTTNGERQMVILAAIANMAKLLNIKVVVEGVEFVENVTMIQEVGCTVAQGYYFAKPMNEKTFEELYGRNLQCSKD